MKDIHILYGFSSESIAESISLSLRALGYRIFSVMRPTKQILKEYLEEHGDVDAVILKEFLDGGDSYSIREIVDLVDNVSSHCKFIVVMSPSYRGKESVRELYNAGILEVIFSDGKRGIEPDRIAELAVFGRTRKEAREYYKIDRRTIKKQHLTYMEFKEAVNYLSDEREGLNIMDRFEHVTRWFTAEQLASFITSMPAGLLDSLKGFREYYDYHNQLYRKGLLTPHLRCPRDAVKGLDANEYRKGAAKSAVPQTDEDAPVITPVTTAGGERFAGNSGTTDIPVEFGVEEEQLENAGAGEFSHGSMGADLSGYIYQQRRAADEAAYGPAMQQMPGYQNDAGMIQDEADLANMDVDGLLNLLG